MRNAKDLLHYCNLRVHNLVWVMKEGGCVRSESLWYLGNSSFWQREGWVSVDISCVVIKGGGDSTRAWTAIWQLMLHLWHLSQTLVSDVTRYVGFVQWKSFKSSPLKGKTAMSYGAEAPSPQRKSSYKWNGSAQSHNMWRRTISVKHQGQHWQDNPLFQMTLHWQFRVGPWLCWTT